MNTTFPKISIVTPSFNQALYLEKTIQSVLSQNYPNLEYIIIDGGSTDGSVDIIKKYEHQLKYWISEKDDGLYSAIQKGFEMSTGDIMAWINSDDLYHPNAFATVAEIFSSLKQVQWLQGNPSFFDEKDRIINCTGMKRWIKYDFYAGAYQWIQQESAFWRRELWIASGSCVNTSLKYAGDFELWLRFFRHEKLYVTTALLGGYRMRSTNQLMMDKKDAYFEEVKTTLQQEKLDGKTSRATFFYRRLIAANKVLKKTKILNIDTLMEVVKYKFFDLPPVIALDRASQKFKTF